jgi:RNA polymerase sigma-70 factor (ECF subfamily)
MSIKQLIDGVDFGRLRRRLFSLAYRMLGSRHDAEDAVQDVLLRWHRADTQDVRSPEAWLVTALTRICIDRLRALTAERAFYVGPWLPEPLVEEEESSPEDYAELASDLSMALLVILERLAPEERAAFLLHDVFEVEYAEIARTLGRNEAGCRQMVHRARDRIRLERPRFEVSESAHRSLVEKYLSALHSQDSAQIAELLAPDALLVSDGGGKVWAARRQLKGVRAIVRLETGVMRRLAGRLTLRIAHVNGRLGTIGYLDGQLQGVTYFETGGGQIRSILRILNPDKLRGLS